MVPQLAFLHQHVFLRLFIPLASGIAMADYLFGAHRSVLLGLLFCLFLLSFFLLLSGFFYRKYTFRWLFGAGVYVFFLTLGMAVCSFHLEKVVAVFPIEEATSRVVLTNHVQEKEKSLLFSASLQPTGEKILLYFSKDSLSKTLKRGDELLIRSKISLPKNNGNPDEFNYSRYLLHQGISGTAFIASGNWKKNGHTDSRSLRQIASDWQHGLLNLYHQQNFLSDQYAVLSALTIGYKDDLSDGIRESFSISGASHVLALSGLHVGFLYGLLLFLMRGFSRSFKLKIVRAVVIIAVLWLFAFIAGLSPSVVRSAVMFSFFALSTLANGRLFSLNSLSAAAFMMLLVSPCWLFDVGFQLSFVAVTAILFIHPLIYNRITPKHKLLRYVWGILSVSLAAQIGTAPLVLYYFSRFSTHFLLTNLLVIPLASVIMYLSIAFFLFIPLPFIQQWIVWLLKQALDFLNSSVRWVEHLPYSSLESVWVYTLEVPLIYLLLFFGVRFFYNKEAKTLICALTLLLSLCSYHFVMRLQDHPRNSIAFYNIPGCAAAHIIRSDGSSLLAYADTMPTNKRMHQVMNRHWSRLQLETPVVMRETPINQNVFLPNRMYDFCGKRICFMRTSGWALSSADSRLRIDYLYVCKGYKGTIKELTELFKVSVVLIDGSFAGSRQKTLADECTALGIHFISLAEKGSVTFLI